MFLEKLILEDVKRRLFLLEILRKGGTIKVKLFVLFCRFWKSFFLNKQEMEIVILFLHEFDSFSFL